MPKNSGTGAEVVEGPVLTTVIYDDGTYKFICEAVPGTALSAAGWRVARITKASGTTYYSKSGTFGNAATDLATVQGHTYA